jgi:oxygen-independent coproporphyrinogen-3 oxidase
LLGPKKIEKILSWLDLSEDCEITLEANPENITPEAMRDFNQCGINRVSIGVQSLENTLLKKLGRTHTAQEAIKAIYATAEAGFHNICIDLMYDLPDQTLFHWQSTLEQALPLPISHLSLYNLTVEPHTVFFKKRTSLRLPDSDTSFQMLKMALSFLEAAAFRRYEISAFSRKEHVSCHNIGYWTGRPFLGLGPSASSFWNGSRFRNFSNLSHYSKALANGLEPLEFKETLEKKELHKEQIAIGLRMLAGIPLSKIDPTFKKQIENLEKNGFVEKTDFSLRLTEQGLLFHDTIAEEIMSF